MIHWLAAYRRRLLSGVSPIHLFSVPPVITFRPAHAHCPACHGSLKVQKTHSRTASTLHVGQFRALEVILLCTQCGARYRSEELGNYVCHLDATCEGLDPLLMSSLDSLSEIVLGNVKLPSEDEQQIVPYLQRLKQTFGVPVALVHDMGTGILKAVAKVFPGVADFICNFHFLRDVGKDLLRGSANSGPIWINSKTCNSGDSGKTTCPI